MPWSVTYVEAASGFDWLNAASTLLGVILGAGLTYLVTSRSEAKRTKEQQLGQAYSLLFTVQKMSDDLLKLQRLISESRAEAAKQDLQGPLWQIIDQVVGYSDS